MSLLLVGGFLYYGLEKMKIAQATEIDLYAQIPKEAILVLELNNLSTQWPDIELHNIIWDEFRLFNTHQNIKYILESLDSSLSTHAFDKMNEIPALVLSVIPNADRTHTLLVQLTQSRNHSQEDYIDFICATFQLKKNESSSSKSFTLYNAKIKLYGTFEQGILSISTDPEIITHIDSDQTSKLISNANFNLVRETSSSNIRARLFILPNPLLKSMALYANKSIQTDIDLFPKLSSWIALDIDLKPDEITMSGFAMAHDTIPNWLSIFKGQEPTSPTVIDYLPHQTAFLVHYGFSDFTALRSKMMAIENKIQGYNSDSLIAHWNDIYHISIENNF